ncbi:RNA binding motif, single stranded interacting protein 2, isoform CRA_b [Rattus norvegicus]|uniref:RNA binding motif, single stranded interacting protein 2, isoform CRA_b n=1 Tax=Rattus norvegicus TaxID=10116 RepID=A6KSA5_RAT|nr:RNA binding motif, single stranded interacting protein 2, isoform CRA_b [Rattus norvegicus]
MEPEEPCCFSNVLLHSRSKRLFSFAKEVSCFVFNCSETFLLPQRHQLSCFSSSRGLGMLGLISLKKKTK